MPIRIRSVIPATYASGINGSSIDRKNDGHGPGAGRVLVDGIGREQQPLRRPERRVTELLRAPGDPAEVVRRRPTAADRKREAELHGVPGAAIVDARRRVPGLVVLGDVGRAPTQSPV